MFVACINTYKDRETFLRQDRRESGIDATIPSRHADERALAGDEAVLDHPQELIGTQTSPHVSEPALVLPGCDGCVCPEHGDARASVQIGCDLGLGQTALVQRLQQCALATETGVSAHQPTCDLACRRHHHFVL
jgi:hypothetical protein